jgi:hypothetical protein
MGNNEQVYLYMRLFVISRKTSRVSGEESLKNCSVSPTLSLM